MKNVGEIDIFRSLSIFSVVFKDSVCIAHLSGTTFCVVAILSRFQLVANLVDGGNRPFAILICTFYDFAMLTAFINLEIVSIVRIVCLVNLRVAEEEIGEKVIRSFVLFLSFVGGIVLCGLLIFNGDVITGPAFSLFSKKAVLSGKNNKTRLKS